MVSLMFVALASLMLVNSAFAIERGKDGYVHTGDGVRVKWIAFVKLKTYAIGHDMRELPAAKSKQAVIDADVDKRISWRMLRDAGGDRLQGILRDSFAKNNYGDRPEPPLPSAGVLRHFLSAPDMPRARRRLQ